MKISQFNIIAPSKNDENLYLIYNTHTTAFVTLDKQT